MKRSVCFVLLLFACTMAWTQDTSSDKKWMFLIEPYMILPNMSGDLGLRNLPAVEVDASPSDIFSNLKFGGMLTLEAQSDKWTIASDFLYMNLEQDATPSTLINSGKATAEQLMFELDGLYRFAPFLEAGVGGRINYLTSGIDVTRNAAGGGTETLNASVSQTWFDPVIITRLTSDVNDKWLFGFRGDFGGFGIGSTFTWQLQGDVGYRFSHLFHTSIGYRILGMDYDKGTGEDRFRYNVNTFGAEIRFGFTL